MPVLQINADAPFFNQGLERAAMLAAPMNSKRNRTVLTSV
jgi:hypothetical protein